MKLVLKLAVATFMLSAAVQVQADSNSALQDVSTTRGKVGDVKPPVGPVGAAINTTRSNIKHPSIADQGSSGGLSSYKTAPPPKSGGDKRPAKANDANSGAMSGVSTTR